MERFFIDGRPVQRAHYTLDGTDPGFLRGLSVFETLRTYHGVLFRLDAHLDRLQHGARATGVPLPARDTLRAELTAAVDGLGGNHNLRMTVTASGRRLTHVRPIQDDYVGKTLRVVTRRWEPSPWLDGRIKHTSRANAVVALQRSGADEVFWVGRDGLLTEATRSSIFGVINGQLLTPRDDGRILPGVTRAALLDAGRAAGLPVHEGALRADAAFDELYATSTLKELAPVITLDGRPAPGAGPLGAALSQAFRQLVRRECDQPPEATLP